MIMMGILLFLEFTGGVCIIIWGMEESDILVSELHEVFIHLVHVMDYDFQAQKVHKQIMEYVSMHTRAYYLKLSLALEWSCLDT